MAVKTSAELKAYFETGDKPTQLQCEDLIDTIFVSGLIAANSDSDEVRYSKGDMDVWFRQGGKTDGGGGDQFLFGDFDGWSAAGGGLAIGLANNFHAWWNLAGPARIEWENDTGELQFYIEAGAGNDAWYGVQEGATHHWSFGHDQSQSNAFVVCQGFGLTDSNTRFQVNKNSAGCVARFGIGMFATSPPTSQPAAIADVSSGTDAAYETAINGILAALRGCGMIDT